MRRLLGVSSRVIDSTSYESSPPASSPPRARSVLDCGGKAGRDAAFAGWTLGEGRMAFYTARKRCRRSRLAPFIPFTAVQNAVALASRLIFSQRFDQNPHERGASGRVAIHLQTEASDDFQNHTQSGLQVPAKRLRTEISSSISSQWMPTPRPIKRQLALWAGEAARRRGYHSRGAEMRRPSASPTMSSSSVISTSTASAVMRAGALDAKVLIPSKDKVSSMFHNEIVQLSQCSSLSS